MNLKSMKTSFMFTILAIASLSGTALAACSNSSQQAQAPNAPTTEPSGKQDMMQGGMNHSMSMDLGPADANYDLRFIDGMTPHHQGAVDMAKEAISKSKRPEIKKLAQDIIAAQNIEIKELKQWRQAWYPKAETTPMAYDAKMGHMMPMSQQQMQSMMMKGDLGAADDQFDLRFINAMTPHHEGAVTMAQDALKKTKRPEIKKLSQNIITSQQKEIEQMKQWKKAWYKQ
jgi:uncharacterized protein (DUF305 family)